MSAASLSPTPDHASEVPQLARQLASRLSDAHVGIRGAELWSAPYAGISMPNGFGEEAWIKSIPDALLVWQKQGAPVIAEWGRFAGKKAEAGSATLSLSSPGMPNYYRAEGASLVRQVYLPEPLVRRVAADLGAGTPGLSMLRDDLVFFADDALHAHLEFYADRAESPEPPSRLEMEARAVLIVDHLLRRHHGLGPEATQARATGGLAPQRLQRVVDFMHTRLCEGVALAELADLADLSPYHFCRAFKQSTGVSPQAWLTRKRMGRAQELMRAHPEMGIAEIALCVGYESQPAFTTAFRRVVGATPARWRRETGA